MPVANQSLRLQRLYRVAANPGPTLVAQTKEVYSYSLSSLQHRQENDCSRHQVLPLLL
jgi:hypothetical protein